VEKEKKVGLMARPCLQEKAWGKKKKTGGNQRHATTEGKEQE